MAQEASTELCTDQNQPKHCLKTFHTPRQSCTSVIDLTSFFTASSLQRKVTLGEAQLKLGLTAITKIFCRNRFVTPWITLENSAGRS